MENLYKKSKILYFLVYLIVFIVVAILLWPLFDLIVCNVFTHSEFVWTVQEHIIQPIVFGVIITIIEFLYRLYKDKKANNSKQEN